MDIKQITKLADKFLKFAGEPMRVEFSGDSVAKVVENIAGSLVKRITMDHAKGSPGNTYYGSVDYTLNPDPKNPRLFGVANSSAKVNIHLNNEYSDPDISLSSKVQSLNNSVLRALVRIFNASTLPEGQTRQSVSKEKLVFLRVSYE